MASRVQKRRGFGGCGVRSLNSLASIDSLVLSALNPRRYFGVSCKQSSFGSCMLNSDWDVRGEVDIIDDYTTIRRGLTWRVCGENTDWRVRDLAINKKYRL